jgi:hypothetical protein
MDNALIEILTECKYTPLVTARFSKSSFNLEINEQAKALTQGKGYYSILNTIVVMAFRKFMLENAVYNPGLCIVDMPLHGIDREQRMKHRKVYKSLCFSTSSIAEKWDS